MEQAKKRDHKIFITDIAIDKVPYVEVDELSRTLCEAIQKEHKEILRISKTKNESNEVLSMINRTSLKIVRVKGTEFKVSPSDDPKAVELFNQATRYEIMYLHNHPSTNSFSLRDIMEFIRYGIIGLLSVVTNQGEVYILCKSKCYDFKKASEIFNFCHTKFKNNEWTHNEAVKHFLKDCGKGGIIYAKSN